MRVKNGEMRGRMRGREDKEGEGTILSLEAKKESKKPALVKLLGCVNGERHERIVYIKNIGEEQVLPDIFFIAATDPVHRTGSR